MARGHIYVEYTAQGPDSHQGISEGIKLPSTVPFQASRSAPWCCSSARLTLPLLTQTAEREVRQHWQVPSNYSICFTQHDLRRGKDFAIPEAAWDFEAGEDVDLKLVIVKRQVIKDVKDEKAMPVRSTTPAHQVPVPPVRSTSPRHSPPPPATQQPPPIDDDAIVPATPEHSEDETESERREVISSSSSQGSKGGKVGKTATRAQSRTFSREKLAAQADGERPPSPRSSSQRPFPSLPTASSAAISPIVPSNNPAAARSGFPSSSAGTSSEEANPLPRHQLAVGSSQASYPSPSSTDRSEIAGRGRHDAVSPFRGDPHGSEEEQKAAIRWGKQRQRDSQDAPVPAVVTAPATVPSHSPRRSSVGSDFCIGLVGDELAFVARSPTRPRPPTAATMIPARVDNAPVAVREPQSQAAPPAEEDAEMEEQSSESQGSSRIIKEEPQSSPGLFRPATTTSGSGSGSSGQALKHHSSASAAGGSGSLEAFPLDVQARQALLQRAQVAPVLASPRGTKRKEVPSSTTPRSSPRRLASNPASPNKRLRNDTGPSSAPQQRNSYLDFRPLAGKKSTAPLKARASMLAATPSSLQARSPAGGKKKGAAAKGRQSLPAVDTRTDAERNALPRADLPPAPQGARKSNRWNYRIRLPAAPISPHQSGQRKPEFVFTRGAVEGATEGLTLQFIFEKIEAITGWHRRDLKIRCMCYEDGGGSSRSGSSASGTQASGMSSSQGVSSQGEPGAMVERFAWGWVSCSFVSAEVKLTFHTSQDHFFIGHRDLEEWGMPRGACVEVDYYPYDPLRPFFAET